MNLREINEAIVVQNWDARGNYSAIWGVPSGINLIDGVEADYIKYDVDEDEEGGEEFAAWGRGEHTLENAKVILGHDQMKTNVVLESELRWYVETQQNGWEDLWQEFGEMDSAPRRWGVCWCHMPDDDLEQDHMFESNYFYSWDDAWDEAETKVIDYYDVIINEYTFDGDILLQWYVKTQQNGWEDLWQEFGEMGSAPRGQA